MNDDILWKIDSEIGKDNKVVELRRKNEELTNENDYLKRKCSEMGIALKIYEKGKYQEHLEIERLNNIINKAVEYIENDMSHCKSNGKLTRKALLEILRGEE